MILFFEIILFVFSYECDIIFFIEVFGFYIDYIMNNLYFVIFVEFSNGNK